MAKLTFQNRKRITWKKALLLILAAILLLHLILLSAIPPIIMSGIVGQRVDRRLHDPADYGVQAQRITLHTQDDLALAAWRVRAEGEASRGTVILLSGIQNPSVTAFFGYAGMLAEAGWDSLLIEMRARCESEGDETGLGMTEWLDVKAGVELLDAEPGGEELPIVVMGTSMGAATVLIAAGELPRVDGVLALSAFSTWPDVFADAMRSMGVPGYLCTLDKPFLSLYLGLHYGFDLLPYTPMNGVAKLGDRPLLLMHSTQDTEVPYPSYQRLLEQARRHGVPTATFVRAGDEHFICYDDHFAAPQGDVEFRDALLGFLDDHFSGTY